MLNINVCGLRSKLIDPEFTSFVSEYDIVLFVDTKTDDNDELSLPGFQCHFKNRKSRSCFRSGGIAIFIRDELTPFTSVCDITSELVFWLKIRLRKPNSLSDIYIGVVYTPPPPLVLNTPPQIALILSKVNC